MFKFVVYLFVIHVTVIFHDVHSQQLMYPGGLSEHHIYHQTLWNNLEIKDFNILITLLNMLKNFFRHMQERMFYDFAMEDQL